MSISTKKSFKIILVCIQETCFKCSSSLDNKDSLYHTENSIQYLLINYNGKEFLREYRYIHTCWNDRITLL